MAGRAEAPAWHQRARGIAYGHVPAFDTISQDGSDGPSSTVELLIEPQRYRNQLVSFGIDEEVLQSARTRISATSEEETSKADAKAAAEAAAAAAAIAAAASDARLNAYKALNAKRERAGKAGAADVAAKKKKI